MAEEPTATPEPRIESTSSPGTNPPEPVVGTEPKGEPAEPKPGEPKGVDGEPADGEPKKDGDGEPKPPEPKPAQASPGPDPGDQIRGAPAEYAELTVPEGTEIHKDTLAEFKSFAKEQDLTQEQAQKLLEFGGAKIKALAEAPYKVWAETQQRWQAEVKADPEIGGTKFEQSIKDAALVFVPGESNPFVKSAEEAGALRQALNMTGAGNNPAIVKLFVKLGTILKEPATLSGGPVRDSAESLLAKMYPTMTE